MDTSVLLPEQWGLIFTLLSLDAVSPLYEAMGLHVRQKARLVEMLRQLIVDNRKIYQADPTSVPRLADRVLQEMRRSSGEAEVERFYAWATTVFIHVHADQPHWSAWHILFNRCAYDSKREAQLGLPPEKSGTFMDRFRRMIDTSHLEQQVKELKARPLSDWDLEMYAIHQFHNDDVSDPFAKIIHTAELYRFQLFWEKLLSELTVYDQERLLQQGQFLLSAMGVWMPEPLKLPRKSEMII